MVKFMMANGNSIKDKDTGIKYIQMVINMKVIGTKIENKGMVF